MIVLDGNSLTPELLHLIGYDNFRVRISERAWIRVREGRQVIEDVVNSNRVVYGVNTGFGLFSKVKIEKKDLQKLQLNLIRSHSAGIGEYISKQRTRMLLALRINVLAKGHSGISAETLQQLVDALNADCVSCVPEKGTVGASGDLAPLAHLALGLMGEGSMWNSEGTGTEAAMTILHDNNLQPLNLKAKEGLALINGTQFMTCLGIEALLRAENAFRVANVVAAMSLEVLKGTIRAYSRHIHRARPHTGQMLSAGVLRHLLHSKSHPSEIAISHQNCGKVQDAYTLRCAPQVHGICYDTNEFVRKILTTEMNSATDNPMIFAKQWLVNENEDINEFEADTDDGTVAHLNRDHESRYLNLSHNHRYNHNKSGTNTHIMSTALRVQPPSSSSTNGAKHNRNRTRNRKHTPTAHLNLLNHNSNGSALSVNQTSATATETQTQTQTQTQTAPERRKEIRLDSYNHHGIGHTNFFRGTDEIISGGNFHGEYPAKVLDFLAIAVHELGNMSERRTERLNNPTLSDLPAFLINDGGLNSGFMLAHCTSAALVSENKVLCHPSSVDSLSTSAAKEDHVSMGGYSARKALTVVSNVEYILAIELMCATQGIDLHRPHKTTTPLEKVYECVRSKVKPLNYDRFLTPDIEQVVQLIRSGVIWQCVAPYVPEKYHRVPHRPMSKL